MGLLQMDRRRMVQLSGMTCAASAALRAKAFAAVEGAPVAATTAGKISGLVEDGIRVFRGRAVWGGHGDRRGFGRRCRRCGGTTCWRARRSGRWLRRL